MSSHWGERKEKDESEIAGEKILTWVIIVLGLACYLYVGIGMEMLGWPGMGEW